MNTFTYHAYDSISKLTDLLTADAEAGIDPAFDSECEELERQFAELRLSQTRDLN